MSPLQLIWPTSPVQVFAGSIRRRRRFSRHRTRPASDADFKSGIPLPALIPLIYLNIKSIKFPNNNTQTTTSVHIYHTSNNIYPTIETAQQPQARGRGPIYPAESFVPATTFLWGGGEDIVCGRLWNPSLICEVLSSCRVDMPLTWHTPHRIRTCGFPASGSL